MLDEPFFEHPLHLIEPLIACQYNLLVFLVHLVHDMEETVLCSRAYKILEIVQD